MPNNILITPGSASIEFSGSAANNLKLQVLSNGNVAITGSIGKVAEFSNTGQVFITSSMQATQFTGSLGIIAFVGTASRVNDGAYLSEAQTFSALKTFASGVALSDSNLTGVNNITINDPGVNEGISWAGGNLWKIYESPNGLTDGAGNLQIVENTTRRATFNTSGQFEIPVATGTAPFVVSSTTLVTNLNADLLDGYNTATANTANTVVVRDGSGNFSAGTITAYLAGYADAVDSNDTRATNDTPSSRNSGVYFDFKQNSTNGLSDGGTYNGQMTWRSYGASTDLSGGQPIQIAYTANARIWTRIGTGASTWASWRQLLNSVDQLYAYNMDQNVRTTDNVTFSQVTLASTSTAGRINFGTDGTDIAIYRDNTYDLVVQQNASSGNPLHLAGAGAVRISIDANNNETTQVFIVGNNAIKSTNELFSVNESGTAFASADFRAPIFYDSAATAYFADFAATGTSINIQGSLRAATYNKPAILSVASGTSSTGGSFAIQQETGEGWTGIFVDYEPYTGWGLWHDNPNNYFSFTAEASTGQIRSFTVPSRVSGNRTAYEKFRIDQNNGDVIVGRDGYAQTSFRAPVFYETSDTSYLLDPDGYSRFSRLVLNNARVSSGQRFPVGHYTPGETVFEMDPTWTNDQLQAYFNSGNVSWVADSTSPGGYAIQIVGNVNVGGVYGSGFPYIPVDQDDVFYMEVWIRNVAGSNTHYMGSIDFNASFTSLGGNPGSFGYWVMSNSNPGTSWTKYSGYIGGFGSSTGQFVSGTEYWTPQALFNYTGGGTCYISGWKVIKVSVPGNRTFRNNITVSGTTTLNNTITMNAGLIAGGINNGSVIFYRASNPWSLGNTDAVLTVSDRSNNDWGIRIDKAGADYGLLLETTSGAAHVIYANGGNFRVYGDGRVDAPIYYDYNSTTYYVDPASTSNMNALTLAGNLNVYAGTLFVREIKFRDSGGGTNSDPYLMRYVVNAGNDSWLEFQLNDDSNEEFRIYGYSCAGYGCGEYSGNLYHRFRADGYAWHAGTLDAAVEMRSPIFRDLNDTGYYMDPQVNTTYGTRLRSGILFGPNPTWGAYLYVGTDGRQGLIDSATPSVASTNGNLHMDAGSGYGMYLNYYDGSVIYFGGGSNNTWGEFSSGIFYAYNQMRSPIFYDYNNAAYYVDPASNSFIRGRLDVQGGHGNSQIRVTANGPELGTGQTSAMTWWVSEPGITWNAGGFGYNVTNDGGSPGGFSRLNGNYGQSYFRFDTDGNMYLYNTNTSGTRYLNMRFDPGYYVYVYNYLEAGSSLRAPIFYDSNDTGGYLDPREPTNGLRFYSAAGWWQLRGATHWDSQPGIDLSGGTSEFRISSTGGNVNLRVDGWMFAYDSSYFPFIYDTYNTGYYWNGDGDSQFSAVYANNWFRPQGCSGVYWQSYGRGIWSPECAGSGYGTIATYGGGRNGWPGYAIESRWVYMSTGGDNVGVHDNSRGNWLWYWDGGYTRWNLGYNYFAGDVRSWRFYDHDTTYYGDFNDRTNWQGLTDRGKDRIGLTYKTNWIRSDITGDTNYWVGSMGWGAYDMYSIMNWGSGFFDTWAGANYPPGHGHWTGVQAYHYSNGYNSAYGWQLVGGPASGAWYKSSWPNSRPWYKIAMYGLNEYSGEIWSSIMYDSNNGGYYSDPDGLSRLNRVDPNEIYNYGWFRNHNSGQGMYNQSTGMHWYSNNGYWKAAGGGFSYGGTQYYRNYESDIRGYGGYWDSNGFGMLSGGGSWAVNIHPGTYQRVTIAGGPFWNAYSSTSGARLMISGGDDDAAGNYYIGNNIDCYNGCYNKLELRWHTGIRIGAQTYYGGIRMYNTEDMDSLILQVGGSSEYIFKYRWMYTTSDGFYSDTNSAHWHPNVNSSYGSWNLHGSRSGWTGMKFQTGGNYQPHLMFDCCNNGLLYYESTGRWGLYYQHDNACLGIHTSYTQNNFGIWMDRPIAATMVNLTNYNKDSYTKNGSLAIGRTDTNYDAWYANPNAAGMQTHCADTWEWAMHDSGHAWWSALYYTVYGYFVLGRNIGWGNNNIWAGGTFYNGWSDERLKTDITVIENPIEKLKQLKGVYYVPNDLARDIAKTAGDPMTSRKVGVLAQDVEKVLPEIVTIAAFDLDGLDENGKAKSRSGLNYMTIEYDKMIPLLIEAIKAQQIMIEELQNRINSL